MYTFIAQQFTMAAPFLAYAIYLALGLLLCLIVRKIVGVTLTKFFSKFTRRPGHKFYTLSIALVKNNFFARLSNLTIPIFLSAIVSDIGWRDGIWGRIVSAIFVVVVVAVTDSFIRSVGDIWGSYGASKSVPVRGIVQVLEIVVFIVGGIVLVSVLIKRNPAALLGGIGAMTAIVTIVFKDPILGFIAGIQLAANDMVQVGDIIEFPSRGIIGEVRDISLLTVKVEALDKTTVSIPAYTFISEPFVNRRSMLEANARRITRSLHIDAAMVRACDEEMIVGLKALPLVSGFAQAGMANTTIFRKYVTAYLQNREDIRQDMTILVRQHSHKADAGIPFEVYAFTTATALAPHENTQSEIFDHLYAVVGLFGLRVYQRK